MLLKQKTYKAYFLSTENSYEELREGKITNQNNEQNQ